MSRFRFSGRLAAVVLACVAWIGPASAQEVFREDFGTTTVRIESPHVPQEYIPAEDLDDSGLSPFTHGGHHYRFADPDFIECPGGNTWEACVWNSRTIDNGYYAVVRPANIYDGVSSLPGYPGWANWWASVADHTGNDGAVLVVNGGMIRNEFYHRSVPLVPGGVYRVSAWRHVSVAPVGQRFEVQDTYTGKVLTYSPTYTEWAPSGWQPLAWEFTVPAACSSGAHFVVALRNMQSANVGNDFYIDDIVLEKIGEDPDAPPAFDCPEPPGGDEADLSVAKDNGAEAVLSGQPVTYAITVANAGPGDASGAVVADSPEAGLDCGAAEAGLTCEVLSGDAECPTALDIGGLLGSGIAIPAFPADSSLRFGVTCLAE